MMRRFGLLLALTATAALTETACQSSARSTGVVPSVPQVRTVAKVQPPIQHLDRIAIRIGPNGYGEFYDEHTGVTFTPRGNNYIRLAQQLDWFGRTAASHSTFNVGIYDGLLAGTALDQMQTSGYNVVRVFLTGCCKGTMYDSPAGPLSNPYMANLADFIRQARDRGIRVIITTDFAYGQAAHATNDPAFQSPNGDYLTKEGVTSDQLFWADVVQGLHDNQAPFDAIFSFELRAELSFNSTVPPFAASQAFTPGVITTGDGKSYDTSDRTQWRAMMDSNLINWANQVTAQLKGTAPHTLVSIGFFPPNDPIAWRDTARLAYPYPALTSSGIDYIKLSLYPVWTNWETLTTDLSIAGNQAKPAIMGEYGVTENIALQDAAKMLLRWQLLWCNEVHLKGWLLWTWDTTPAEQGPPDGPWWNAIDGGGAINNVLSPAARPDPCIQ
jgi:hypothetical protein